MKGKSRSGKKCRRTKYIRYSEGMSIQPTQALSAKIPSSVPCKTPSAAAGSQVITVPFVDEHSAAQYLPEIRPPEIRPPEIRLPEIRLPEIVLSDDTASAEVLFRSAAGNITADADPLPMLSPHVMSLMPSMPSIGLSRPPGLLPPTTTKRSQWTICLWCDTVTDERRTCECYKPLRVCIPAQYLWTYSGGRR